MKFTDEEIADAVGFGLAFKDSSNVTGRSLYLLAYLVDGYGKLSDMRNVMVRNSVKAMSDMENELMEIKRQSEEMNKRHEKQLADFDRLGKAIASTTLRDYSTSELMAEYMRRDGCG